MKPDFQITINKHFDAAALVDAAKAYETQIEQGYKMMITLAGAMSTDELGKSHTEMEAMRKIEDKLIKVWTAGDDSGNRKFPHEYFYEILLNEIPSADYQIDAKNSWLLSAVEKNLPILVPDWEDSTCGNFFASYCIENQLKPSTIKSGIEYMMTLSDWYQNNSVSLGVGFFQIGGGLAGDFPICVVPMLHRDLRLENIPVWSYFCQISDSTTSFGS